MAKVVDGVDGNAGEGAEGDHPAESERPLRIAVLAHLQRLQLQQRGDADELI